jgi:CheY-like chemotaxis protein
MKSVLFVDDHEVLARLSCQILQMHGYRTECAYDAGQALEKFEREKFDLLVTDYLMEGMNGLELAKALRRSHPKLPVIVVTGFPAVEGSEEVDVWLEKHDMFPTLIEKIKLLIGEEPSEMDDLEQTLRSA